MKKFNLKDLKVKSFVISQPANIKGGGSFIESERPCETRYALAC